MSGSCKFNVGTAPVHRFNCASSMSTMRRFAGYGARVKDTRSRVGSSSGASMPQVGSTT